MQPPPFAALRRSAFVLLLGWGLFGLASASALGLGDDLRALGKAQAYPASRPLGALTGWPGWETALVSRDRAFTQPPFLLVLRKVGATEPLLVFGAVDGGPGNPLLWLDADGDGRVDLSTKKNVIPGWLGLKVPGPRKATVAFRQLADRIYRPYNSDRGPAGAEAQVQIDALKALALDETAPDRDLAAALAAYLDQSLVVPALAAGTLEALGQALETRGGAPALVWLFRGEAQAALDRPAEARARFEKLKAVDPGSVIAAFKLSEGKPADRAAFAQAHPDFWALR